MTQFSICSFGNNLQGNPKVDQVEIFTGNLIVGYFDSVKIFNNQGNCLQTFDLNFTKFYRKGSQFYIASFDNNIGHI